MKFILLGEHYWELDENKMLVFNYRGGHHSISQDEINTSKVIECENWHDLYLKAHYCPIETDKHESHAWISPDGTFYEGNAHEVQAEDICEIVFGLEDEFCPGDVLEEKGFIRVTTTLMWEVRIDELASQTLTQKQYDALFDWCQCHNKEIPQGISVK